MFSDGGKTKNNNNKKKRWKTIGRAVSSDNDTNQEEKSDEIERKEKLQNKVRCQRYRDRRKSVITFEGPINWCSG